jgi:DnaJ-class molecular chaperone
LPVRFSDCRLPSFDLGPGRSLDSLQWVDLFDDVSWDSAMTRLIASVRYVQNGSKARSAWSGPRSYPSGESRRPREIKAEAYQRGVDLEANVTVSAAELAVDTIVSVHFKEGPCSRCQGTGAAAGTDPKVCRKCRGTGQQSRKVGRLGVSEPCATCGGRGLVVDNPCSLCSGDGRGHRTLRARIPPGIKDGQRLRVQGQRRSGRWAGAVGDLYVRVQVKPEK